jgi:hypothetical protein
MNNNHGVQNTPQHRLKQHSARKPQTIHQGPKILQKCSSMQNLPLSTFTRQFSMASTMSTSSG